MVWPDDGMLCGNKKEWNTDTYYNMDETRQHSAEWKMPVEKELQIAWFHIYVMFRIGKYIKTERQMGARAWGMWGENRKTVRWCRRPKIDYGDDCMLSTLKYAKNQWFV